jgi:hypothetical protein
MSIYSLRRKSQEHGGRQLSRLGYLLYAIVLCTSEVLINLFNNTFSSP